VGRYLSTNAILGLPASVRWSTAVATGYRS